MKVAMRTKVIPMAVQKSRKSESFIEYIKLLNLLNSINFNLSDLNINE